MAFTENIILLTFLVCCIIVIAFYLLITFNQLKNNEVNRLKWLLLELEREKTMSNRFKKIDLEIKNIEKQTKIKFNIIDVSILNIEFSLFEIFK